MTLYFHVLWLAFIVLRPLYAYYLSYNTLYRSDAESFCVDQCNSHLASIHSINDFTSLTELWTTDRVLSSPNIEYGFDLWIGLYQNNNAFYWSDTSPFDFGTNISGSVSPWDLNEPGAKTYVYVVNNSQHMVWKTVDDTDQHSIFACNDCTWNVINKYIFVPWKYLNWNNAEQYCYSRFGTSLASIHSEADSSEAERLCRYDGINCYIGLNDQSSSTFVWSDASSIDLGWALDGQTPWANGQPDDWQSTDDCVILSQDKNYQWDDTKCWVDRQFICNMPSELCYASNWNGVNSAWLFSDCEVTNNNIGSQYNLITLNIAHKQWKPIVISYRWKFNHHVGRMGIVINIQGYDDTTIYKFYVGFVIWEIATYDQVDSIIEFNDSNIIHRQYGLQFFDQVGFKFNEMRIELNDVCVLSAYVIEGVNNWKFINDANICDHIPNNYFIQSIGIQNKNITTFAKSLYINGAYNINAPTNTPTIEPSKSTNQPSYNPTITPTNPTPSPTGTDAPTLDPTQAPTADPTIYPTFIPTTQPTTNIPTINPSKIPTVNPSLSPTNVPSDEPTLFPIQDDRLNDMSTTTIAIVNHVHDTKSNNNGLIFLTVGITFGVIIFILAIFLMLLMCRLYTKKLKKQVMMVDKEQKQQQLNDIHDIDSQTQDIVMDTDDNVVLHNASVQANDEGMSELQHNDEGIGELQTAQSDSSSSDELYNNEQAMDEFQNDTNSTKTPLTPLTPVLNQASAVGIYKHKTTSSNASDEDMYRTDLVTDSQTPMTSNTTQFQNV